MTTLADKTIANLEEIRKAAEVIVPKDQVHAQEVHVALHANRCPRCGDKTFSIFPGGSGTFCEQCMEYFRSLERDGVMWFVDMLEQIHRGGESS